MIAQNPVIPSGASRSDAQSREEQTSHISRKSLTRAMFCRQNGTLPRHGESKFRPSAFEKMPTEFDFLSFEHFEAMANLWHRAHVARGAAASAADEATTLELIRERATKGDAWFAGQWSDGHLVAIVHGAGARAGEPIEGLMHLSMVAVDPDRWGRGIGRAAAKFALTQARLRGYGSVQLWTHLHNARARRLYQSLSFVASGRRKDDGSGNEILHYVLKL